MPWRSAKQLSLRFGRPPHPQPGTYLKPEPPPGTCQGSTAINRQSDVGFQATDPPRQPDVQDLVARIRVLLDASAPSARDAGDYEKALETIEADEASPARDRSSITRALRLLTGAAGMVTGWADAVTALQRAIGRL